MNDDALIAGFEAGTLPLEGFDHVAHVRIAWLYAGRLLPKCHCFVCAQGFGSWPIARGTPRNFTRRSHGHTPH